MMQDWMRGKGDESDSEDERAEKQAVNVALKKQSRIGIGADKKAATKDIKVFVGLC